MRNSHTWGLVLILQNKQHYTTSSTPLHHCSYRAPKGTFFFLPLSGQFSLTSEIGCFHGANSWAEMGEGVSSLLMEPTPPPRAKSRLYSLSHSITHNPKPSAVCRLISAGDTSVLWQGAAALADAGPGRAVPARPDGCGQSPRQGAAALGQRWSAGQNPVPNRTPVSCPAPKISGADDNGSDV